MGNTTDSTSTRTWAHLGGIYHPHGPPKAVLSEDQHGLLMRVQPFGQCGPDMQMTLERWRQVAAAAEKAIAEHVATKLAVVAL